MAIKTSATDKNERNETQAHKDSAKASERRNLDLALQSIVKTYGENAIMRLGDAAAKLKIDVVPTGCFDSSDPDGDCQCTKGGRNGGCYRCGARFRSCLREKVGSEYG